MAEWTEIAFIALFGLVMLGLGAIAGFLMGAKVVLGMAKEVLPLGKKLLGGGKMGWMDILGGLLSGKFDLGALIGGRKQK